jgi:hypothetical protein
MARYRLKADGVLDTDTGNDIPPDVGNRHWREYLEWVSLGNTADPEFTPEQIAQQSITAEIANLKADLFNQMVWQFRMILALYQAGVDKGVWTASDFDQDIREKAGDWKQKVDRLKVIDE